MYFYVTQNFDDGFQVVAVAYDRGNLLVGVGQTLWTAPIPTEEGDSLLPLGVWDTHAYGAEVQI